MNNSKFEIYRSLNRHKATNDKSEACETSEILFRQRGIGDISQVIGSSPEIQMAVLEAVRGLKNQTSVTVKPKFIMANIKYKFQAKDGKSDFNGQDIPVFREVQVNYDEITDTITISVPSGSKVLIATEEA